MSKEVGNISPTGNISPRRGKPSEAPSLLHASSASFPDLPKRPDHEAPTLAYPPSPQHNDASANGPMGFLRRIKKNVEQGLRPLPGGVRITTPASPSTNHVPSSPMPNPGKDDGSSTSQFTSVIRPGGDSHTASSALPTTTPYRIAQFDKLLAADDIDLEALRAASWNGIPCHVRAQVWQMLLNYMPLTKDRRDSVLMKRRSEYYNSLVPLYNSVSNLVVRGSSSGRVGEEDDVDRTSIEGEMLRQILVDIPRTASSLPLFSQPLVRKMMERTLYIFAIRHPACGYVQGMNDLLVPIIIVMLQGCLIHLRTHDPKFKHLSDDPYVCDVAQLPKNTMEQLEADCYWCFSKFLDTIQDHYIHHQPGIQRCVVKLEDLVARLDPILYKHMKETHEVQFIQFAFRWCNCLLIREFPINSIVRLYDTYFAQEHGKFTTLHVYVCCVLLMNYKAELLAQDFMGMLTFLQNLPTQTWSDREVESILAQAYILSHLFDQSPSHLNNTNTTSGDS